MREVLYYLPITDAEKDEYTERFGVRLLNSYGNSECLVGAITDPPTGERRWPSIGRVGPGYQARIADEQGHALPDGETGEIQLRGEPGVTFMAGYLDDPAATAALYDADGWMHTGDLGHRDADGWFYFADRRSRVIKRGAENISPARVEAVLAEHPAIAEASVIGVPDPIYDQAVKAVVAPKPGHALTADAVIAHCAARLPRFMVPTVVELVDHLPQTRSFKVATSALD
ncbi:AMP-binding enzyme [Cellulomonas denverensis]|uniref:AMP-binding enzyme n=1 Tax=Cellulomonas denverensis TaxID=264297 RepID=UPI0035E9E43B